MKIYIAVHECTDFPTSMATFSTREAAEKAITENIGGYILSCIKENERESAQRFIDSLVVHKEENGETYLTAHPYESTYEDFYIVEQDLDTARLD